MPTGPYSDSILIAMDHLSTTLMVELERVGSQGHSDHTIRGSEIGKCSRRLGYQLLQYEGAPMPTGIGQTFSAGRFYEALVVAALESIGFELWGSQDEVRCDDPPITGHTDGYVIPYDREAPMLLEVKSANDRWFADLCKSGVTVVYPDYLAQMTVYMGLDNQKDPDVPPLTQALLVVTCKNFADIYTEIVDFDPALFSHLLDKVRSTWEITRRGDLPSPEYHKSSRACGQCSYRALCPGKPASGKLIIG